MTRAPDGLQVLVLLVFPRPQVFDENLAVSDDRIERIFQFMTYLREELGFRQHSALNLLGGLAKLLFRCPA